MYTVDDILQNIHEVAGANQTALYYFSYPDYDQLILHTTLGVDHSKIRYWRPHCSEVDTIEQIKRTATPFVLKGEPITGVRENIVALPIFSGENVIGVLVLCYLEEQYADLAMLHIELEKTRKHLFAGWIDSIVADQTRPLSVLFHIAGTISSSLDLERVLLNVVEQATILFRVKMSSLHLIDWKKHELEMITAYGCSLNYLDKPNLPLEGSFLGNVVKENKAKQIENIFEEPLYFHKDIARKEGVYSMMAAPISFQNQVLGILNIYSAHLKRWQRSEMELLQTFANHAAIAITNVRVHEQILNMEEQLHRSAKRSTLGELAAGLAHEIRNPLAVINILIHSWKSSPPDPEDFNHDVNVVAQKISDLNNLVNDLLNLSTTRPLDRQPHNLDELVDRVYRLLRHRINQQKVSFKKSNTLESSLIPVDRERLEQAVLNLLLNALDVTPSGETISVDLHQNGERVAVDISDTGPGIPEEQIPNLFKVFRSSKQHGTGLGLPITRRIVEEHKGELLITRNNPDGATFTILLPINAQD